MKATRVLDEKEFINLLISRADETHMWIVYRNGDFCLHFDAEIPEGVDTPFKLATYDKFIKARVEGVNDENIK